MALSRDFVICHVISPIIGLRRPSHLEVVLANNPEIRNEMPKSSTSIFEHLYSAVGVSFKQKSTKRLVGGGHSLENLLPHGRGGYDNLQNATGDSGTWQSHDVDQGLPPACRPPNPEEFGGQCAQRVFLRRMRSAGKNWPGKAWITMRLFSTQVSHIFITFSCAMARLSAR